MAEEQNLVLSVPDMSCAHCVNTINSSLQTLAGVENVQVDLPTKTVHLRYHSSQISLQQIESVLDDAGYTAAVAN
jgi:copper chaperone